MFHDFLRQISLFGSLTESDFGRICGMVQEIHLAAGEELFAEGSTGDKAYIIKEGQLEVVKTSGGREVLLAVRGAGNVIGEMSLLEKAPRMATVRARTDSVLLVITQQQFDQLLETSPSAARTLLNTVLTRWRATEGLLRQSEKMAQLGTLVAGIAHELNNPAAAVRSGAEQLRTALRKFEEAHVDLHGQALSQAQWTVLLWLAQQTEQRAAQPLELDALARSDRESKLETWLEGHDVPDAWELAPALVSLDYDVDSLATLADHFTPQQLPSVICWLEAACTIYSLLAEIGQGAEQISTLVGALKTYAYLDQAPLQNVDVHQGLDNTLLILRNKLKSGVSVRRVYAPDLPKIEAYGSELNQVWTNIIDNAIDALNGQGEIVIRTRREEKWVVVEIEDNGPGIPAEVLPRIFDPFFTTKPIGQGTGLGLDIAYNIVVLKHRGDIKVHSEPGSTCFEVWLPINQPETVRDTSPSH